MDKRVAIVQARMGSSRFPGKVLQDLNGRPMLEYQLERIQRAKNLNQIVIATSTQSKDDPIAEFSQQLTVPCFRGSEPDVLARYFHCAKAHQANIIVRITADCPIIEPTLIDDVIDTLVRERVAYASNVHPRHYPDGLDVEAFTFEALRDAHDNATDAADREHVTPYIQRRSQIASCACPGNFGDVRWTVDFPDDLDRIRELISSLPKDFHWLEALSVAMRRPHLLGPNI